MTATLSRYLAFRFLVGASLITAVLAPLIFLVDFVTLVTRGGDREGFGYGLAFAMALLKLPSLLEQIIPFLALFGAMAGFAWMARRSELVVARASGVSIWGIVSPALAAAAILGIAIVALFNPVAAALAGRFEALEAQYLRGQSSLLAVSASGLWLRQGDGDRQAVVHALRVDDGGSVLEDVTLYLYAAPDKFLERIDARRATIGAEAWALDDVVITAADGTARRETSLRFESSLTPEKIQESFASPRTVSFWELPRFIAAAEAANLTAARHRHHYYTLLSLPFLMCAMVLIAATATVRRSRSGGTARSVGIGVVAGFAIYVLGDVTRALGASGAAPAALSAFAPAIVAALIGAALLLDQEDG